MKRSMYILKSELERLSSALRDSQNQNTTNEQVFFFKKKNYLKKNNFNTNLFFKNENTRLNIIISQNETTISNLRTRNVELQVYFTNSYKTIINIYYFKISF